jgi:hypothetical protein
MMTRQDQILEVISLVLTEVEHAQLRGDLDLEMRLERISQTLLGFVRSATLTDCAYTTDFLADDG